MCFKREKCEILCKLGRRVASTRGPHGGPHLLSRWYLQTLYDPPACWSGAKTHHTVSRNILPRCENLSFLPP